MVGYAAAGTVFASFCMQTMLPLRVVALMSNALFISYGYLDHLLPVLILHLGLLPMNTWRLAQVLRLRRAAAAPAEGFDIALLRPYMTRRLLPAGSILFRRGEPAAEMFYVDAGELVVEEAAAIRGPGSLIGEMGLLAQHGRRTATVLARTDCVLLTLPAAKFRQLYFQHPGFALHLLDVLAERLIPDMLPADEPDRRTGDPSPAPPLGITPRHSA
jgi:CRP/FNR family transcriptional regulator, cyclic AMP receptor protein